jgi:hypothetical protein
LFSPFETASEVSAADLETFEKGCLCRLVRLWVEQVMRPALCGKGLIFRFPPQ